MSELTSTNPTEDVLLLEGVSAHVSVDINISTNARVVDINNNALES